MTTFRLPAGRTTGARRTAAAPQRASIRRRSGPRLKPLEARMVLSGPGTTLDASKAPDFIQAALGQQPTAPEWKAMYGASFAMTPAGDVMAVRSTVRTSGGPSGSDGIGVVEIWERSGRDWSLTASPAPPPSATSNFIGVQMAISADGSTLVATAQASSPDDYSLPVYVRDDAGWSLLQDIDAPGDWGGGGDHQRAGLTISGDGGVIALGSPARSHPMTSGSNGMVRVYAREGETWGRAVRHTSPAPASPRSFGTSVALADRPLARIQAPGHLGLDHPFISDAECSVGRVRRGGAGEAQADAGPGAASGFRRHIDHPPAAHAVEIRVTSRTSAGN